MSVSAIVEVIASAIEIAVRTTASATLVTKVIGQRQADRTAVPTVFAELPEPFAPCCVTTRTAVEQVAYVQRQRQLFVEEGMS